MTIFPERHQPSELYSVLYRLFWLRNLAIAVQITIIFTVHFLLDIRLPFEKMMVAISILTVFNLFVAWRLHKRFPVTEAEIAIHLGFDSFILATLLFHAGGSSNPFVSLFLVPIALAASFLSLGYAVSIAVLCIGLYSFLMVNHHHMPSTHGRFGGDFNFHVFGMWINFILSSIVAVIFITGLAKTARERAQKLASSEKELLRNEYVVSLGTLAAGTAHEISTPLSNIGMMADELQNSPDDAELVKDFSRSIKEQQQHCVEQLQILRSTSEQARQQGVTTIKLHDFLNKTFERWAAMRPEIKLSRSFSIKENPVINDDLTIAQTITNLLNNAADASLENQYPEVNVSAEIKDNNLLIHIDDYGTGFSDEQAAMAGEISFTSKESGLGLGLILSHASLARYDGSLTLIQRDTGIRSSISIPLDKILADE